MITDLEFEEFDAEFDHLFREAESDLAADTPALPNEERVERIVAQAKHEAVIKDTADFFFRSFGPVIIELFTGILGSILPPENGDKGVITNDAHDSTPGTPDEKH